MADHKKRAYMVYFPALLVAAGLVGLYFFVTPARRVPRPVTAAEASAIQGVIDGVTEKDPAKYRGAFLPGYDEAVAQETAIWKYGDGPGDGFSDFNAYLRDLFTKTHAVCTENYGENFAAEFVVGDIKEINTADYPSYFERYDDLYVYDYVLDTAAVEQAAAVSGHLNIWGDKTENSSPAEYIFIKTKDGWYLHPAYYFMTFG